jgi:hypothetical protein
MDRPLTAPRYPKKRKSGRRDDNYQPTAVDRALTAPRYPKKRKHTKRDDDYEPTSLGELKSPAWRYLPPSGRYYDEHDLEGLLGDETDRLFCLTCMSKDCVAHDPESCNGSCALCETNDHRGKECPMLYCTYAWWRKHNHYPELSHPIRPTLNECWLLAKEGIIHPVHSATDEIIPAETNRIVKNKYRRRALPYRIRRPRVTRPNIKIELGTGVSAPSQQYTVERPTWLNTANAAYEADILTSRNATATASDSINHSNEEVNEFLDYGHFPPVEQSTQPTSHRLLSGGTVTNQTTANDHYMDEAREVEMQDVSRDGQADGTMTGTTNDEPQKTAQDNPLDTSMGNENSNPEAAADGSHSVNTTGDLDSNNDPAEMFIQIHMPPRPAIDEVSQSTGL